MWKSKGQRQTFKCLASLLADSAEAKYNQLMRIEEELGDKCAYAGESWRKPCWMA